MVGREDSSRVHKFHNLFLWVFVVFSTGPRERLKDTRIHSANHRAASVLRHQPTNGHALRYKQMHFQDVNYFKILIYNFQTINSCLTKLMWPVSFYFNLYFMRC